MAHDGYVNPVDQAWDSDWQVKHDDSGRIVSVAFKRRFCKECGSIIRRNAEGLLECSCGRIFSGGYDDWPITTRYIWGQKR